ncbi:MAG: dihydroorotate dehydrogenase [Pseudomonadota bacterium]
MMDDRDIDRLLAEMAQDEAPVPTALRTAIVEDAVSVAAPVGPATQGGLLRWLSGWGGAMGVPVAAMAGLWIGIAQPSAVLLAVPGLTEGAAVPTEADLVLAEVFGDNWEALEP